MIFLWFLVVFLFWKCVRFCFCFCCRLLLFVVCTCILFTAVSYQMSFHWCYFMYPHWGLWNKPLDLTWTFPLPPCAKPFSPRPPNSLMSAVYRSVSSSVSLCFVPRINWFQTSSTGLRHPSFGGRCRKAMLGVWVDSCLLLTLPVHVCYFSVLFLLSFSACKPC